MPLPARADTNAAPALDSVPAVKLHLSELFARETDIARLLQTTLDTIGRFLGVSRVAYGEIDPGETWMEVPADWVDGVPSRTGRRPFDRNSAFSQRYREGRTLAAADILDEPSLAGERAYLAREQVRAFVGVPLIEDGRFVAVFNATHVAPRAWSEDEILLVAQTGARLWGALQHLRTLARLRDSEEQFRTLAENIPALCWLTDARGNAIWGNSACQAFFAGTPGAKGEPLTMVHPDEVAEVTGGWLRTIAEGGSLETVVRLRGRDGRYHPFLSRAVPIRAGDGTVARWCGTMIDLSEQQARRRREAFLVGWGDAVRSQDDPATILALTLDLLGEDLGVSAAAYFDAAGGAPLRIVRTWGEGEADWPLGRFGARETVDDHILAVPLVRDGAAIAMLAVRHADPRAWDDGEVELLRALVDRLWTALDRAHAEQRRAESEALLAAFMDNAPLGMHLKDADGRYLRMNRELARQIGLPAERAVGRLPIDLLPKQVGARVRAMEAEALAGRTATTEFVFPEREEYAALAATAFPIAMPGGGMRIGGFTIDVTERQRAAAALAQSRETLFQSEKVSALGSLLAGVSHELNNPLSIVVAQALMLERQSAGGEAAVRARKLRTAAERCARIVQTFLAMARQKRPERRAADLNAIAAAALDLTDYGLRSDGIAVARDLAPDLPSLSADADQLHQVVVNLIVNAQQAMAGVAGPRRLALTTRADPAAGTVSLDVSDTGPGVPAPARRRIFEPFYTTKPQGEGTGLGLSFSQGLAEAHGGRLELVEAPGGACFRLTLPVGETPRVQEVDVPLPAVAASPRRALVVDDEPDIAESLADLLSLEGFACEIAIGGAAAQALLAIGDFDLIVSDLRMPDVDGPKLHAWIAKNRPDLLDRVAFATGDTLGATAASFLAGVARPVLEKPFTPEAVARFVAEARGT